MALSKCGAPVDELEDCCSLNEHCKGSPFCNPMVHSTSAIAKGTGGGGNQLVQLQTRTAWRKATLAPGDAAAKEFWIGLQVLTTNVFVATALNQNWLGPFVFVTKLASKQESRTPPSAPNTTTVSPPNQGYDCASSSDLSSRSPSWPMDVFQQCNKHSSAPELPRRFPCSNHGSLRGRAINKCKNANTYAY